VGKKKTKGPHKGGVLKGKNAKVDACRGLWGAARCGRAQKQYRVEKRKGKSKGAAKETSGQRLEKGHVSLKDGGIWRKSDS